MASSATPSFLLSSRLTGPSCSIIVRCSQQSTQTYKEKGYPIEPKHDKLPPVSNYTGITSAFQEAGFVEVLRIGCVLGRDRRWLRETFHILPEYLKDIASSEEEVNFCDYGIQLTGGM